MNELLPTEDQQVTIISVRDGAISVTSARALVSKPNTVALQVDADVASPPAWEPEQAVTMIYTHADRVMRLRGVIRECIAADRIAVEPAGEVKEGDRRDYRRADVVARVFSQRSPADTPDAARAAQLADVISTDSDRYRPITVNVSGSGISFQAAERVAQGDLIDVRLLLDKPTAAHVTMIGRVVRVLGGPEDTPEVAVRFAELSEADQDILVYTVFSNHFAAEGLMEAFEALTDD